MSLLDQEHDASPSIDPSSCDLRYPPSHLLKTALQNAQLTRSTPNHLHLQLNGLQKTQRQESPLMDDLLSPIKTRSAQRIPERLTHRTSLPSILALAQITPRKSETKRPLGHCGSATALTSFHCSSAPTSPLTRTPRSPRRDQRKSPSTEILCQKPSQRISALGVNSLSTVSTAASLWNSLGSEDDYAVRKTDKTGKCYSLGKTKRFKAPKDSFTSSQPSCKVTESKSEISFIQHLPPDPQTPPKLASLSRPVPRTLSFAAEPTVEVVEADTDASTFAGTFTGTFADSFAEDGEKSTDHFDISDTQSPNSGFSRLQAEASLCCRRRRSTSLNSRDLVSDYSILLDRFKAEVNGYLIPSARKRFDEVIENRNKEIENKVEVLTRPDDTELIKSDEPPETIRSIPVRPLSKPSQKDKTRILELLPSSRSLKKSRRRRSDFSAVAPPRLRPSAAVGVSTMSVLEKIVKVCAVAVALGIGLKAFIDGLQVWFVSGSVFLLRLLLCLLLDSLVKFVQLDSATQLRASLEERFERILPAHWNSSDFTISSLVSQLMASIKHILLSLYSSVQFNVLAEEPQEEPDDVQEQTTPGSSSSEQDLCFQTLDKAGRHRARSSASRPPHLSAERLRGRSLSRRGKDRAPTRRRQTGNSRLESKCANSRLADSTGKAAWAGLFKSGWLEREFSPNPLTRLDSHKRKKRTKEPWWKTWNVFEEDSLMDSPPESFRKNTDDIFGWDDTEAATNEATEVSHSWLSSETHQESVKHHLSKSCFHLWLAIRYAALGTFQSLQP